MVSALVFHLATYSVDHRVGSSILQGRQNAGGVRKCKAHLNTAKCSFDYDANSHKLHLCGLQNLEKSHLFSLLNYTLEPEGCKNESSCSPGERDEGSVVQTGCSTSRSSRAELAALSPYLGSSSRSPDCLWVLGRCSLGPILLGARE